MHCLLRCIYTNLSLEIVLPGLYPVLCIQLLQLPASMPTRADNLKHPSNAIFLQVAAVYVVIFSTVYLVTAVNPRQIPLFLMCSVLAWSVIGWCQFALFNALHEGLHRRFGRPHRERLSYALAAYPLGFDDTYRKVHLDHHKYFGDAQRDPDHPNYGNFPVSKRAFLLRMLLNLCGWYALLQLLGIRQGVPDSQRNSAQTSATGRPLLRLAIAQFIILLIFSGTIGWPYYFWLWLVPLATFGKFFSSTRTFCEHASPDNRPTIRTITGSYLGEKILGVFCFHYHAEHHLHVGIPYNQLRQAHELLQESMYVVDEKPGQPRYELYQRGYLQLLYNWFQGLPT